MTTTPEPRTRGSARTAVATAVALGVPLGALTFALQLTPFGLVANSPAFWAMWGFAAGAIVAAPRAAVLTATGVELLGLVSWYTTSWLTGNFEWSAGGSLALGWGAGALAAGMVFGLAGAWWRTRATTPRLEIATAVPVSVFACAAVYYAFILNYTATATYNAAVALLLLAFLPPANRDRLRAAAAVIPITALGIAGGAAFITFLNAASGT